MMIIKGDTKVDVPSWVVVLSMAGLIDIAQIVVNTIIKKSNN